MTDDELDRRLREAMDVAASPALAARVRARIADEAAPATAWRWLPALAGGFGVAAVIATLVVRPGPSLPPVSPVPVETLTAAVVGPDAAAPVAALTPAARRSDAPVAGRAVPPRSMSVPAPGGALPPASLPALQLAPGDAEAFRVLLAFSRAAAGADGAMEPAAAVDPLNLPPIDIAPLEIVPLALADDVPEGDPR